MEKNHSTYQKYLEIYKVMENGRAPRRKGELFSVWGNMRETSFKRQSSDDS